MDLPPPRRAWTMVQLQEPKDERAGSPSLAESPSPPGVPVLRRKRSLAPVAIAVAVLAIGFAVVASSTSGGAGMYNYTLAQLARSGAEVDGSDIKIAGRVAKGSVRGQPTSKQFRFALEDDSGHSLGVAYGKLLPDPFEEGRDAIVAGRLTREANGQRLLQATSLTVKCPSRYGDAEMMTEAQRQEYYQTQFKAHRKVAPE